jgi:hypothetical protein
VNNDRAKAIRSALLTAYNVGKAGGGKIIPHGDPQRNDNLAEPKLKIDNPGGKWLQNEIEYVKSEGRNQWGAPRFSSVTGTFDKNVNIPVDVLKNLLKECDINFLERISLRLWRQLRYHNKKQFEDPYQIELRRTKCNKIQGMKIYHNYLGETKYYLEGTQPIGWVMGRPRKEKGA